MMTKRPLAKQIVSLRRAAQLTVGYTMTRSRLARTCCLLSAGLFLWTHPQKASAEPAPVPTPSTAAASKPQEAASRDALPLLRLPEPASEDSEPKLDVPSDLPPPPAPETLQLQPATPGGALSVTMQEAVRKAWGDSPVVKNADARVRETYWAWKEAGSMPSTNVGLGTWTGAGAAQENGNYISSRRPDYYAWLQQPFRPLGSITSARQVAYRDLTTARAQATLTRLQVANQVKDAFYSLLSNQQQLDVAEQNLNLAELSLQVTSKRFEVGSGPRLDQINATIQRNRARQDLVLLQGQRRQSEARLAPLLGLPATTSFQAGGTMDPPSLGLLYDVLLQTAAAHPRLQAAEEQVKQSYISRVLAQQATNPTPALNFVYDIVQPSFLIQATLSVPIDWGAIGNDVNQKREIQREKEQLLEQERLQLSSDIRTAYEAYQAALTAATSYKADVLTPTEESARITEFGYTKGALAYPQLLIIQQNLANTRKDYIDRLLNVHLSLDALEAAVGRELEGPALP